MRYLVITIRNSSVHAFAAKDHRGFRSKSDAYRACPNRERNYNTPLPFAPALSGRTGRTNRRDHPSGGRNQRYNDNSIHGITNTATRLNYCRIFCYWSLAVIRNPDPTITTLHANRDRVGIVPVCVCPFAAPAKLHVRNLFSIKLITCQIQCKRYSNHYSRLDRLVWLNQRSGASYSDVWWVLCDKRHDLLAMGSIRRCSMFRRSVNLSCTTSLTCRMSASHYQCRPTNTYVSVLLPALWGATEPLMWWNVQLRRVKI